jgi:hypothetical protein
MNHLGYVKMKEKLIIILLILVANNAYAVKTCKDENGRTYFTDIGCPEGTVKQGKLNVKETNTYRTRESINIDMLNDYERRHNTGRSWRWKKKRKHSN